MTPIESVKAEIAAEAKVMPIATTIEVVRHANYVAVVGSRGYPSLERVVNLVGLLHEGATVVTGGAHGVDRCAETYATQRGLRCAIVRPSARGFYLPADLMGRNTVIVRGSDIVVAFWDGTSSGTKDSIQKALLFHGFCVVALPDQAPEVWVPEIKR